MLERPLIVGAGLSGAVVARVLAGGGISSLVIDERDHIAGNCHTIIDEKTNILVHKYGPHIFHTDNETVWSFVQKFAQFRPYVNRVKAVVQGKVYSMPINLHTINQFFDCNMSPQDAKSFIQRKSEKIQSPQNFEEQALAMVGPEIYRAFFENYTRKQWGIEPNSLPASVLKRLPLRFNYDDNYFFHKYQGIPKNGYTELVQGILDHPLIETRLQTSFEEMESHNFGHVFYTGAIDEYFKYSHGSLSYRTLDFEEIRTDDDVQGTAVMNYCDLEVPWTRITEHKYFAPWRMQDTNGSVAYREFSKDWTKGDIRYYPVRLGHDTPKLKRYLDLARDTSGTTFLGRLGTYRYLDMDVAISEAMTVGEKALDAFSKGETPKSLCYETP